MVLPCGRHHQTLCKGRKVVNDENIKLKPTKNLEPRNNKEANKQAAETIYTEIHEKLIYS